MTDRSGTAALNRLLASSGVHTLSKAEAMLKNTQYVIDKMVPVGSYAVIVAQPGNGKTLGILSLLLDAVNRGQVEGQDVFYFNEDDNFTGFYQKVEICKPHGINMTSTVQAQDGGVRNIDDLIVDLNYLTTLDLTGKVMVFDCLKKFVDVMNKSGNRAWQTLCRRLTGAGATIIALAHANKRKENDKVVFAGVQDVLDDCDIMYLLESNRKEGSDTYIVEYLCNKDRGAVKQKHTFQYTKREGTSYAEMLHSFKPVTEQVEHEVHQDRQRKEFWGIHKPAADFLRNILNGEPKNDNEIEQLRSEASPHEAISRRTKESSLKALAEIGFLNLSTGMNNAKYYRLNNGYDDSAVMWSMIDPATGATVEGQRYA